MKTKKKKLNKQLDQRFKKRNFIMDLADLDISLGLKDKKGISLSQVFNNLSWYPLLILLMTLVLFLINSQDILDKSAGWFLLIIWIVTFVAVLIQTSVMLTVMYVGIIRIFVKTHLMPSKFTIVKGRRFQVVVALIFLALGSLSVLSSMALMKAVNRLELRDKIECVTKSADQKNTY
jgi:hypothetical protein